MQLVDDVDQIGLVGHDLGDRLVGVGVLVDELLGHGCRPMPGPPLRCGATQWSAGGLAALRPSRRPAPCELDSYDASLPLPRTMNDDAPIDPGMTPMSERPARIAPLRVIHTSSPRWISLTA